MRPSFLFPIVWSLGWGAFVSQAEAQDKTMIPQNQLALSSSSPKERLQQLQDTYEKNAVLLHRPVLLDYLQQLKLLRTRLTSSGNQTELSLIEVEIADTELRLQHQKGFNLEVPKPGTAIVGSLSPQSYAPRLVLNADQAKGMPSEASTVSLGRAQWLLPSLEPGHYQISVMYAPPSTASPMQLRWAMHNKSGLITLAGAKPKQDASPYHAQVLGEIQLDHPVKEGFEFQLENASPFAVPLHVRHVVISKAISPP